MFWGLFGGKKKTDSAPASTSAPSGDYTDADFEAAVSEYQRTAQAGRKGYEDLFGYLEQRGFKAVRPTRGDGRTLSDDKVVNAKTGKLWDLMTDSEGANPQWRAPSWSPDQGYWYDGRPQAAPIGGTALGGSGQTGGRTQSTPQGNGQPGTPTGERAVPKYSGGGQASNDYAAARAAAMRTRQQMRGKGRSSTILAGFGNGAPTTRGATLLGGRY